MKPFILLILFVLSGYLLTAQHIDSNKLYEEISNLNRNYEYELSIARLENIINNSKSSSLDKYYAYVLKSQTYKRVFNYPFALDNLELAYEVGMKTSIKEEVETRIAIEKMFIMFDLLKFDEVKEQLKHINKSSLKLIDGTTLSFYYNVLAVLDMKEGKYEEAEKKLNEGIEILKNKDPQHLPAIYVKIIGLAEHLDDLPMAIEAFEKGMFYAEEYQMDIYKIRLYKDLSLFYVNREDFENAYLYEKLSAELFGTYNAPFQSGRMNMLEKELLENRKDLEIKIERNLFIFASILVFILCVLIVVLFKFFKVSKQKRKLVEDENERIRIKLKSLSQELHNLEKAKVDITKYDLSERQLEIIQLIKRGKTNKEIGNQLFISENTVKYHLKIIYNVMGIDNRIHLKE